MTSTAVDPYRKAAGTARGDPQWTPRRVGQIVAAQAAVAGLLAALGHGPIILTAACTLGGVVVIVAFARVRGRWLHAWLAVGIRYATRRHSLAANATPAELMRFLAPDAAPSPDAAFVDADGLVAVFELDGPLLASEPTALPDLARLMDAANDPRSGHNLSAAHELPPGRPPLAAAAAPAISPLVRIDLLVTAAAAPTSGLGSATAVSYRQLTGDRVPAHCRTFVVLRVLRPSGWSDADLRPTMSAVTRRVAKRLGPHRRLGHEDAATTMAELAHHEFTSRVDERWAFVEIGGLCQATYRVTLPTGNEAAAGSAGRLGAAGSAGSPGSEGTARAVHRLLTLPTAATTISVSPRRFTQSLAVRLAAGSPQQLERADQALRQLAAAERASVRRLDGEHRTAAAETLLVGGHSGSLGLRPSDPTATRLHRSGWRSGPTGNAAARRLPDEVRPAEQQHAARSDATRPRPRPRPSPRPRPPQPTPGPHAGSGSAPQTLGGAALPPAGLVLGYDRYGIPVVARIFRPVPTRLVVVGGLRTAQLVAIRALALGALVDVRTRRWAAWSGFADQVTAPTRNIIVTPDAAAIPDWATPGWNGGAPAARRPDPAHNRTAPSASGTPLRPTLTIVDAATRTLGLPQASNPGPDRYADDHGSATPGNPGGWHATITVRDELTSADTPLLTAADLVMLQTLRPDEANLVADTFAVEGHLTAPGDDMVALIATGQPLRWATLVPTPIERFLTDRWDSAGTPSDVDALQPVTRAGNSPRGGD